MSFQPKFSKGLILKDYMLESLKEYPQTYIQLFYSEYGDGIIDGFKISIGENDRFSISPGILKLGGEIYFLNHDIEIAINDSANIVYIDVKREQLVDGEKITISLIPEKEEQQGLFELFRYVKNAELFMQTSLKEVFNSTLNRIDQSNVKHSIKGGSSLMDFYFKMYAREILNREGLSANEYAFAYQGLNGISDVCVLKEYFGTDDCSNASILELMKNKLEHMGEEKNIKQEKAVSEPKREQKINVS